MFSISDHQEHLAGAKITRALNAPALSAVAAGHGPTDGEGARLDPGVPLAIRVDAHRQFWQLLRALSVESVTITRQRLHWVSQRLAAPESGILLATTIAR